MMCTIVGGGGGGGGFAFLGRGGGLFTSEFVGGGVNCTSGPPYVCTNAGRGRGDLRRIHIWVMVEVDGGGGGDCLSNPTKCLHLVCMTSFYVINQPIMVFQMIIIRLSLYVYIIYT